MPRNTENAPMFRTISLPMNCKSCGNYSWGDGEICLKYGVNFFDYDNLGTDFATWHICQDWTDESPDDDEKEPGD